MSALDAIAIDEGIDPHSLKQRSVRGATLTLGAQGVRFLLQFGGQLLLTRLLTPAEFGLAAMVGPVLGFVQIFNELGLSQATIQAPQLTRGQISGLFWINIGVSCALAVVLAIAAPAIGAFYANRAVVPLLWATAALLVTTGAGAQHVALLNRRMRFGALATIDVSCAVAAFLVGLLAASCGAGVWALILMQAANGITILTLAWVFSGWVPGWPRARSLGEISQLLRFGSHVTGFNVLAYAEANLGAVLLGRFAGAGALGLYDRGFKLVIVPWWQLSLPVSRVAVTLLSRLSAFPREYAVAWRRMVRALLLLIGPGMLWAAVNANWLAPLLLGRTWVGAVPIMRTLALATVMVPLAAAASWLFVSQGRVRAQFQVGLWIGGTIALGAVIGVAWGALGVARGYLVAALLGQTLPLWVATRVGPVGRREAWGAIWPVLTALLVSAGVQVLAAPQWQGWPVLTIVPLSLCVAYLPVLVALTCTRGGRSALAELTTLRGGLAKAVPPTSA